MKIYTLGTAPGSAAKGRACTSTLLESGGNLYLIDCGGSVEASMTDLGFNFADLRAVFVTHMHEDHVGALSAVVKRVWGYIRSEGNLLACLPEQNGIDAFLTWMQAMHATKMDRISFRCVTPGKFYDDGIIAVTALPTNHFRSTIPSYAYKIECEGKTVLFSGDMRSDLSDYPTAAMTEDFDCIVSEFTHFIITEQMEKFKNTRTKKLIFNHVTRRNIDKLSEVKDDFPYPVIVASDRECFEV